MDVREFSSSWYVRGEVHDQLDVPSTTGTVIGNGSVYRIDGKGDDQSNAQIDLHLAVPLAYDDAA